jgi:AcrR family transcriptional regulator
MLTKNTLDKRRIRGNNTRQIILVAAKDLFASQGFHATSTRQITDRAGIATGSIYNHFEGKDEIFEAVLNQYHPWFHIPSSVEGAEGDTLEEFVRDSARRMLIAWEKHPENVRLHLIELIEFQGRHLPVLFESTFSQMAKVINQLKKERQELQTFPVSTLSQALLGLFFAYLMTDRFTGIPLKTGFDKNMFEYFTDAYLHGVITKEETN